MDDNPGSHSSGRDPGREVPGRRVTPRQQDNSTAMQADLDAAHFTELTACGTCGTLWRRDFLGASEKLEIVAKRLKREAHLTDPPNGHRVVFWKCHTCGADHIDDSWAELLASVGVRDNAATGQLAQGPPRNPAGTYVGASPPQLMRPPGPPR